jgi:hypothetical protein
VYVLLPLQLDEWLVTNLPEGSRVGLDPFCHTVDSLHKLKDKLEVRDPCCCVPDMSST